MAEKIPLVFAISGHRDIPAEDVERHTAEIANLLKEYNGKYPASPLVMLTSLADGADRIAARAALAQNIAIIAVLPMGQADYETDFTAESLADFRALLARASRVVFTEKTAGTTQGEARDRLYEKASIYLALHSHVLIALWNGYDAAPGDALPKPGGTAATVKFRSTGDIPGNRPLPEFCRTDGSVLDPPDVTHIVHFATRRTGDARTPNVTAFTVDAKGQGGNVPDRHNIDQVFDSLERFNAAVDANRSMLARRVPDCAAYLVPQDVIARYPDLAPLRAQFATADALAIRYRNWVQWVLVVLAVGAVAAVLCLEVFAHIFPHIVWILVGYLAILIAAWGGYYRFVRRFDWQGKYLDYRALAEALRVQFFWRIGGLPYDAADFYLRSQSGDLAWIRHAARACNIGTLPEAAKADIDLVQTRWIADQQDFFSRAVKREHAVFARWNGRLAFAYVSGVLLAAIAIGLLGGIGAESLNVRFFEGIPFAESLPFRVIIVTIGLAPAIAAAIGFVLERRAYESHIRQYSRMAELYGRASASLRDASDLRARQRILEAVGREALAENGDWLFMHRERRVAPPRG